jgi:5-methylcytosine-specific restriction endonuclease McrA
LKFCEHCRPEFGRIRIRIVFELEINMVAKALERPTLVLNRNWQPVNVATVARALVLLWNESARVVDPHDYQTYTWADWSQLRVRDGDPFIQAIRLRLRAPEVIVLSNYDRLPSAAVSFSRRNLFKRDHWTCQYCGLQPGADELTIDHVVPRSQGGTSTWENCVLACVTCNKRKADRMPREAGLKLHKQPIRPMWKPMYARHSARIESWSKFVSEAYWEVRLEA